MSWYRNRTIDYMIWSELGFKTVRWLSSKAFSTISSLTITYHIAKLSYWLDLWPAVLRGRQRSYKGMTTNIRGEEGRSNLDLSFPRSALCRFPMRQLIFQWNRSRRIPKVTAPVTCTFGFSRLKGPVLSGGRYFWIVKNHYIEAPFQTEGARNKRNYKFRLSKFSTSHINKADCLNRKILSRLVP